MTTPPAPTQPAPGWYPDPQMPGTQRYWDGATWTGQAAPLAGPIQPRIPQQAPPPVVVQVNAGGGGRSVSGLTTGGHIFHGTLTILTGGLWGIVWFLKWRLGRRAIR